MKGNLLAFEDGSIGKAVALEAGSLHRASAVNIEEGVALASLAGFCPLNEATVGLVEGQGDVPADEVVREKLAVALVAAVEGPDALADCSFIALLGWSNYSVSADSSSPGGTAAGGSIGTRRNERTSRND